MSMISINYHDWSELEAWFDAKAEAAGKPKGSLAYYAHSEVIPVELENLKMFEDFGYNIASQMDEIIAKICK
jgi:hypothetical protein